MVNLDIPQRKDVLRKDLMYITRMLYKMDFEYINDERDKPCERVLRYRLLKYETKQ